jgi:DNA-binding transcriptional LysR family regulator
MLHSIALRYFVEVARSGSLAAASDELHVAVSAISRQIAKLEQEVGAPLFDRMPRGMVLTATGELLAQYARRALLDGEAVLADISVAHALGSGVVRVACNEGFTPTFMPAALATFHAEHPHTRYLLRSGTSRQVAHWVATGEVDIGAAFTTTSLPNVQLEYSIEAPLCALMSTAHPLASRAILTLDDLLAHPVAFLERGTTVRQLIDIACSSRGFQIEPLLTSNNSSALHHFALLTGTIVLGSRLALLGGQSEVPLIAKSIDEPLLRHRYLQLIVMPDRHLPPPVAKFLSALREAVRSGLA